MSGQIIEPSGVSAKGDVAGVVRLRGTCAQCWGEIESPGGEAERANPWLDFWQ